jgi:acetoin utilization protein AcuB
MYVEKWMTNDVVTLSPDDTLLRARILMHRHKFHHLPVTRDGELVGVVSDRDLRAYAPSIYHPEPGQYDDPAMDRLTVENVMSRPTATTTRHTRLEVAARTMLDARVNCLPVLSGHRLVGVLSTSDVLRAVAMGQLSGPTMETSLAAGFTTVRDGV